MKRLIQIIIAFVALLLIGCLIWGFFINSIPNILPGSVVPYKLLQSISLFLTVFPTVVGTAFLLGSSLIFGRSSEDSETRFSAKMFERYRSVVITALASVLFMTLGTQVFLPNVKSYIKYLQKQPELFSLYMEMAEHFKSFEQDDLAYLYIRLAADMYPDNKKVERLLGEYEIGTGYKSEKHEKVEIDDSAAFASNELPGTSAKLLQDAHKAESDGDWLSAHYYATVASRIANSHGEDHTEADQLASLAWKKLAEVSNTGDKATQHLFEQKMSGYNALMHGDVLKAYYIFAELKISRRLSDPDIERYFSLAEQQLRTQFFFTDEYSDLQKYETLSDLHFTIKHPDGSSEVCFARGVTDIREQGNLIRFLREFSVVYFGADGKYIKQLTVPYAKMFSVPVSSISRSQQELFHISGTTKYVPYILLDSVNRNSDKGISGPTYNYAGMPFSFENNYMILAMDYDDFNYLAAASAGAVNMDLFSLYKFIPIATKYGYSIEMFNTVFQERILYPFTCLLFLLFLTVMAWNYRVAEDVLFKFNWIFVVPFFVLLVHIVIQSMFYIFRLVNFTLICLVGYEWCLLVTIVVNLFMYFILSILFLARKA